MWGKEDKMDEDKKMMIMDTLKEAGVEENKIDDDLIMLVGKISNKINMLRAELDEKDIDDMKGKEIVNKIAMKANEMDIADVKEWHMGHEHEM